MLGKVNNLLKENILIVRHVNTQKKQLGHNVEIIISSHTIVMDLLIIVVMGRISRRKQTKVLRSMVEWPLKKIWGLHLGGGS